MKTIFTAWLLVNGVWTHGFHYNGWWPVPTTSEAECNVYLDYAEANAPEGLRFTCETVEDTREFYDEIYSQGA